MAKNKSDECFKCLERYFSSNIELSYNCKDNIVNNIINIFIHGNYFFIDCPDLYIELENQILIIEHFEFDWYKSSSRKGSVGRREKARIDRRFDKCATNSNVCIHDVFKGETSYDYYITNVKNNFDYHYSRIDEYINNLKNEKVITPNKTIFTMFIIENTSPLGCTYADNQGDIHPCSLMNCREFLLHIKNKDKIDYILALSEDWNCKNRCLITTANLNDYLEDAIDYSNENFLLSQPHVVGGFVKLNQ